MTAMPNGDLYVAGTFTSMNGVPVNRIARWNGSVWSALGTGINNAVTALRVFHQTNVIATGSFNLAGGWQVNGIARWDGSAWLAPASTAGLSFPLGTFPNGDLLQIGSSSVSRWSEASMTTVLGTGLTGGSVLTGAVLAGGDIVAGGTFTTAAGRPSAHFARLAYPTADFNHDGDVATDQDIEAFFACLAGTCCPLCSSADFNGDGDVGTDADIESFFRVLAGGSC